MQDRRKNRFLQVSLVKTIRAITKLQVPGSGYKDDRTGGAADQACKGLGRLRSNTCNAAFVAVLETLSG